MQLGVDRLVELARGGVDLDLLEQSVHAEGPGLVGDDRHDPLADRLVPQQVAQHHRERHRRRHRPGARARVELGERRFVGRRRQRPGPRRPAGAAEPSRARRRSIMYWYSSVLGGPVERRLARLRGPRRGSRPAGTGGPGAPSAAPVVIFLIWWVELRASISGPSVHPLIVLARIDRRLAGRLGGRLVGGVQLAVVVAASGQGAQVVVGEVLDQLAQPGVGAEEVLPDVGAVLGGDFWNSPSTVVFILLSSTPSTSRASSSSHLEPQMTLMTFQPAPRKTASSSWMILPLPRTGPSRRCRLQLTTKMRLSSCSRAGQATGRPASRARRTRRRRRSTTPGDSSVSAMPRLLQVPVEMGLVDGVERARAPSRRSGTPRTRASAGDGGTTTGRRAAAATLQLQAEVVELALVQAAFQEGPGVDPGRGVALEEHLVARLGRWPCPGRNG